MLKLGPVHDGAFSPEGGALGNGVGGRFHFWCCVDYAITVLSNTTPEGGM